MSISDQIRRLINAKAAIKSSIENKGVAVSDDATLDKYPALIDSISTSDGPVYQNPDFYELRTASGTDYSYLFYNDKTIVSSDLSNWDTSKVINMAYAFYQCDKLTSLDLSGWDTSNVTSMTYMFYRCPLLTSLDLSGFDTSSVTTMSFMFSDCAVLTDLDVSHFDTKNVTSLYQTFYGCNKLTSLDLSGWDTSNVTTIYRLFASCWCLESLNVSGWNTSKVTNMQFAFSLVREITSLDLTSWDTSNVTAVNSLFNGSYNLVNINGQLDFSNLSGGCTPTTTTGIVGDCDSLETLYLKNIYKNCAMTNAAKWSIDLGDTKVKDECLLYIINELPNLYDKGITNNTQIIFTLPPTNTLTAEQVQPAIDKGWIVVNTNY